MTDGPDDCNLPRLLYVEDKACDRLSFLKCYFDLTVAKSNQHALQIVSQKPKDYFHSIFVDI
jgi:hypothetical protein